MSQLTVKQLNKIQELTGKALDREYNKIKSLDPRLGDQIDFDVIQSIIDELESDFAINNDKNNETEQANDQTIESAPVKDDNQSVGTGLAGDNGELFYWPEHDTYACKPYNQLTAIPKTDYIRYGLADKFKPLSVLKKQALAKIEKAKEVKPTKYYAQFVFSYSFESLEDLNEMKFERIMGLENFLHDKGIEYEATKSEGITIKRLHGQRTVGSTGTTKGGLSDPFERPDPSQPVHKDQIKAVKRGSSAHLALLALMEGINIKDKSESAIARLNELADKNNCDRIEPSQFSWKFRQASLMNGYGHKLLGPNTYQLVLPAGLDTIKVK